MCGTWCALRVANTAEHHVMYVGTSVQTSGNASKIVEMRKLFELVVVLLALSVVVVYGGSKSRPHNHQGILEPYTGRPLPQHITAEQSAKLDKGEPVSSDSNGSVLTVWYINLTTLLQVMYTERDGQAGYGVVVQDINATNSVCMDRITDLANYHKMVPHVKSVEVYEKERLTDVSVTGALRTTGIMEHPFLTVRISFGL